MHRFYQKQKLYANLTNYKENCEEIYIKKTSKIDELLLKKHSKTKNLQFRKPALQATFRQLTQKSFEI